MDTPDFLSNITPESIENLYKTYLNNPEELDRQWRFFFKGFELAKSNFSETGNINVGTFSTKEFNVINLINAYRQRGHLFTNTNPVRKRRNYQPTLELDVFNLTNNDLNTRFKAGELIGIGEATLQEIIEHLKLTYCKSIGVEYLYIRDPNELEWLRSRMESVKNTPVFDKNEKLHIHQHLVSAVGFEKFIHSRFTGQKRFSLEGAENLIPALDALIEHGAGQGVKEIVIGMSHRGRLNVLANILKKPFELIFREFTGKSYFENISLGDVKYHLGYDNSIKTDHNCDVQIHLAPNPSHLETVAPVAEGIAHAIIHHSYYDDAKNVLPVLIHGDAAIAGQGVVYEVVQMAGLDGYGNGGTVHLVINNQVGFTTDYLQARTSTYCTDVAKVTRCPVFHVNGDDVEALIFTVRLALDYRQTFNKDVFIDILSYRKYGHNEGDEPRFTQPLLYKLIEEHPNPLEIYQNHLVNENLCSLEELLNASVAFENHLDEKLKIAKQHSQVLIQPFLQNLWASFRSPANGDLLKSVETKISEKILLELAEKLTTLPEQDRFFRKAIKLNDDRKKMVQEDRYDWAMGELLAFASLLNEGVAVRLSGQDSQRGTFSHRHAALIRETDGSSYFPLKTIPDDQKLCTILNSPLNEYGVLGFEYGYALANPHGLNIWEAQFGDFSNVGQVIIDQYISAAEEKWGLMNGLVMLLPHGYEGQGPEHSSARIERFLTLAANNNMQILNLTTPANLFHALRQQVKTNFRVPMIIFTPKSLLRHPLAISRLKDFSEGKFERLIEDVNTEPESVSRIVFCSGKIYYDLLKRKMELNVYDIAIIRLEQIYPLPMSEIELEIKKYKNARKILWVQEEPSNMGAWPFIQRNLSQFNIEGVARQESGSPAVGLNELHQKQQEEIINKVFKKCTCDLKLPYCGLQCESGHYSEPVYKQHTYFKHN